MKSPAATDLWCWIETLTSELHNAPVMFWGCLYSLCCCGLFPFARAHRLLNRIACRICLCNVLLICIPFDLFECSNPTRILHYSVGVLPPFQPHLTGHPVCSWCWQREVLMGCDSETWLPVWLELIRSDRLPCAGRGDGGGSWARGCSLSGSPPWFLFSPCDVTPPPLLLSEVCYHSCISSVKVFTWYLTYKPVVTLPEWNLDELVLRLKVVTSMTLRGILFSFPLCYLNLTGASSVVPPYSYNFSVFERCWP